MPKIEEVAAQKPAKGFFKQLGRAFEAQVDWWPVAFSNLEKVINVDPLPPEIEWEQYGAQRGTAKKYNEKLLELLLQKRDGDLKQKYTPQN